MRPGQLEAELGEKGLDQMIVPTAGQRLGLGLEVPPAKLDLPLELDELVQRESAPRCLRVRQGFGEVQHANRLGAGGKGRGKLQPGGLGQGIGDLTLKLIQRPPDKRAQPALGQPFGERVNGSQAAEVDDRVLAVFHDFRFRMVHGARLELHRLAEDDHFIAHQRQCSRAVPSSRISSKMDLVCCL